MRDGADARGRRRRRSPRAGPGRGRCRGCRSRAGRLVADALGDDRRGVDLADAVDDVVERADPPAALLAGHQRGDVAVAGAPVARAALAVVTGHPGADGEAGGGAGAVLDLGRVGREGRVVADLHLVLGRARDRVPRQRRELRRARDGQPGRGASRQPLVNAPDADQKPWPDGLQGADPPAVGGVRQVGRQRQAGGDGRRRRGEVVAGEVAVLADLHAVARGARHALPGEDDVLEHGLLLLGGRRPEQRGRGERGHADGRPRAAADGPAEGAGVAEGTRGLRRGRAARARRRAGPRPWRRRPGRRRRASWGRRGVGRSTGLLGVHSAGAPVPGCLGRERRRPEADLSTRRVEWTRTTRAVRRSRPRLAAWGPQRRPPCAGCSRARTSAGCCGSAWPASSATACSRGRCSRPCSSTPPRPPARPRRRRPSPRCCCPTAWSARSPGCSWTGGAGSGCCATGTWCGPSSSGCSRSRSRDQCHRSAGRRPGAARGVGQPVRAVGAVGVAAARRRGGPPGHGELLHDHPRCGRRRGRRGRGAAAARGVRRRRRRRRPHVAARGRRLPGRRGPRDPAAARPARARPASADARRLGEALAAVAARGPRGGPPRAGARPGRARARRHHGAPLLLRPVDGRDPAALHAAGGDRAGLHRARRRRDGRDRRRAARRARHPAGDPPARDAAVGRRRVRVGVGRRGRVRPAVHARARSWSPRSSSASPRRPARSASTRCCRRPSQDAYRGRVFSFYDTLFNVSFVAAAAAAAVVLPADGKSYLALGIIAGGYAVTAVVYGVLSARSDEPVPVVGAGRA